MENYFQKLDPANENYYFIIYNYGEDPTQTSQLYKFNYIKNTYTILANNVYFDLVLSLNYIDTYATLENDMVCQSDDFKPKGLQIINAHDKNSIFNLKSNITRAIDVDSSLFHEDNQFKFKKLFKYRNNDLNFLNNIYIDDDLKLHRLYEFIDTAQTAKYFIKTNKPRIIFNTTDDLKVYKWEYHKDYDELKDYGDTICKSSRLSEDELYRLFFKEIQCLIEVENLNQLDSTQSKLNQYINNNLRDDVINLYEEKSQKIINDLQNNLEKHSKIQSEKLKENINIIKNYIK